MKISRDGGVQPPKFEDNRLNKEFGSLVGRLSGDDTHAVIYRYAEIQVALKVRRSWLDQVKFIAESNEPNETNRAYISSAPEWVSVADEVLEYIRGDQEQLDKEDLLARANVVLAEKVIAELKDSLHGVSLTDTYRAGGARDASPLRHLDDSTAAATRAGQRVGASNIAYGKALEEFGALAKVRSAFAGTTSSVQLSAIDDLSPDLFEEWTAWLLERDGCQILRRRGGPHDQAADVIAVTPDGLRVVIQCKHSTKVGNRLDPRHVYALNGTARPEHGADIVGIVTNRALSDAAQRFAIKHQIHVIDRPVLKQWATYGVPWLPSGSATAATRV